MGTNSKTGHQSYLVAPTVPAPPAPPAPAADAAGGVVTPAPAAADPAPTHHDPAQPDHPEQHSQVTTPEGAADPADGQAAPPAPPAADEEAADGGSREAPLTPIPDAPVEGLAVGEPVLVGGADLHDSTATLLAYTGPAGPREVLLATVRDDAEEKLLAALALSEEKLVPVQVQEQVHGRLPVDEQQQLFEKVAKAARSVNHKLKNETPIPQQTKDYVAAADAAVSAVANDPPATAEEKAMAAHYRAHLDQIGARIDSAVTAGYLAGGKIPLVEPYEHHGTATVTKYLPAPADQPEPGLLPATLRGATRIKPTIDPTTGQASWNGTTRSKANGKEYLVDLGDGYTAVYRPHAANEPAKHEYSLRGQLELHAPAGAGHSRQLVDRLGQLNLVNRPMTAAEGEWTYLEANVAAQQLGTKPQVAAAVEQARHLEELQVQELFHARAHEAVGLDDPGLRQLAKSFQLEAAARVLPKKVRLVREAVAQATGHGSGAELAASPSYDPTPRLSGGWLTWTRWDANGNTGLAETWTGRSLVHRITGGNPAAVLATGVLASTERRAFMGVGDGLGMSENSDKISGGANSVFLRVRPTGHTTAGPALVWDNPAALLARADYYGYNGDHFGAVNPSAGYSTSGMTRDPAKIATFTAGNNEIMFRHGIDLLGAEAPSRILCTSTTQRAAVLAVLAARGVTELAGRPVSEVVQ